MAVKRLGNKRLALKDLEFFPGNARIHDTAGLKESVAEHEDADVPGGKTGGQYKSICVRSHDGKLTILAGNGTAEAMAATGQTHVYADVIECTDLEAEKINIKDNAYSDKARNDEELLAAQIRKLDGDYYAIGLEEKDISRLLGEQDGGDADITQEEDRWAIIVECPSGESQARLLAQLDEEGFTCRAIMS